MLCAQTGSSWMGKSTNSSKLFSHQMEVGTHFRLTSLPKNSWEREAKKQRSPNPMIIPSFQISFLPFRSWVEAPSSLWQDRSYSLGSDPWWSSWEKTSLGSISKDFTDQCHPVPQPPACLFPHLIWVSRPPLSRMYWGVGSYALRPYRVSQMPGIVGSCSVLWVYCVWSKLL